MARSRVSPRNSGSTPEPSELATTRTPPGTGRARGEPRRPGCRGAGDPPGSRGERHLCIHERQVTRAHFNTETHDTKNRLLIAGLVPTALSAVPTKALAACVLCWAGNCWTLINNSCNEVNASPNADEHICFTLGPQMFRPSTAEHRSCVDRERSCLARSRGQKDSVRL